MTEEFDGIKVLVTRPEHQAEVLCNAIENMGGTAIRFPTIVIKPMADQVATKMVLHNISQYDMGIFVSRNAVDWTIKLLSGKTSVPKKLIANKLILIAIGTATARALKQVSSAPVITNNGANSETLLDLNVLSGEAIRGKKIIIFCGRGGREHLAITLRARGARVDCAEVYRRDCPKYDRSVIDKLWASNTPDVVIVTSNNGLENLFVLCDGQQCNLLLNKQLIVISERMLAYAKKFKFTKPPILADENADAGILKAIVKWVALGSGGLKISQSLKK